MKKRSNQHHKYCALESLDEQSLDLRNSSTQVQERHEKETVGSDGDFRAPQTVETRQITVKPKHTSSTSTSTSHANKKRRKHVLGKSFSSKEKKHREKTIIPISCDFELHQGNFDSEEGLTEIKSVIFENVENQPSVGTTSDVLEHEELRTLFKAVEPQPKERQEDDLEKNMNILCSNSTVTVSRSRDDVGQSLPTVSEDRAHLHSTVFSLVRVNMDFLEHEMQHLCRNPSKETQSEDVKSDDSMTRIRRDVSLVTYPDCTTSVVKMPLVRSVHPASASLRTEVILNKYLPRYMAEPHLTSMAQSDNTSPTLDRWRTSDDASWKKFLCPQPSKKFIEFTSPIKEFRSDLSWSHWPSSYSKTLGGYEENAPNSSFEVNGVFESAVQDFMASAASLYTENEFVDMLAATSQHPVSKFQGLDSHTSSSWYNITNGRYSDYRSDFSSILRPSSIPDPPTKTTKQSYQSGSVTRYCDVLDSGVEGNPQMLLDIIKDLRCVFDKTFGNSKSLQDKNKGLLDTIACLREEIAELEACKATLQQELIRIQSEMLLAQKAYEDEAERRIALENMVTQLRVQLNRLEAMAEVDAKERAELVNCVKQLEARLKEACDAIECLRLEKNTLLAALRDLEEWKNRQNENVAMNKGRCGQLEEALAKCCKTNEELQKEIAQLRKERDCLQQLVEKLQCDIKRICDDFERERQNWTSERDALERTIGELKNALDCQTMKNRELCDRMAKVVQGHHQEMNCLKRNAEKFCHMYEQEKASKDRLERSLRECEERKIHVQNQFQLPLTIGCPSASPCSDIMKNFPC